MRTEILLNEIDLQSKTSTPYGLHNRTSVTALEVGTNADCQNTAKQLWMRKLYPALRKFCPARGGRPDNDNAAQAFSSGFVSVFVSACVGLAAAPSFIPSRNARKPSPRPLPSSGSFLGPKNNRAMKKITSRCMGWNRPSIRPPGAVR